MTKKDLIEKISTESGLTKAQVGRALDCLASIAASELLGGGEVPFTGLGKLKAQKRMARTGRNPKTGDKISIPAKTSVKFVVAKELKDALKG